MTPVGDFVPLGTVLPRQAAAPIQPACGARPAPVGHSSANTGAGWQPSPELREAEERINATVRKPKNDTQN
jgi:hypothetical protein